MTTTLGSGEYVYQELANWARLPDGWTFKEVADVVVDARDRVYVFNRSDHPLMVFEQDGTFVTAWGEDLFVRPHGLTLGPDQTLYCADDAAHCIYRCDPSTDGCFRRLARRAKAPRARAASPSTCRLRWPSTH